MAWKKRDRVVNELGKIIFEHETEFSQVAKARFGKLWLVPGLEMVKQLDGEALRVLLYVVTSGMLRYGDNTFMLTDEWIGQMTNDLGMVKGTIYRHIRTLKDFGVIGMMQRGSYQVSKSIIEYGNEKGDWKNKRASPGGSGEVGDSTAGAAGG